jgi:hypothetical protein
MRALKSICLTLCVVFAAMGASAADLRIGVASEVTTLDPHFFHLTSNTEIHKGIYSGLVTQDADMKVVPDLAVELAHGRRDALGVQTAARRDLPRRHAADRRRCGVHLRTRAERSQQPGSFLQYLKHVTKTHRRPTH